MDAHLPTREIHALEDSNPNSRRVVFVQDGRGPIDKQSRKAFRRLKNSKMKNRDALLFHNKK